MKPPEPEPSEVHIFNISRKTLIEANIQHFESHEHLFHHLKCVISNWTKGPLKCWLQDCYQEEQQPDKLTRDYRACIVLCSLLRSPPSHSLKALFKREMSPCPFLLLRRDNWKRIRVHLKCNLRKDLELSKNISSALLKLG